jgi:hypothetical protein
VELVLTVVTLQAILKEKHVVKYLNTIFYETLSCQKCPSVIQISELGL